MSIITIINSLLDSKLVQWLLLSFTIILIVFLGILEFKFYGLKLSNALLSKENATVNSALQVQNQAIKRLGEETRVAEENIKQANNKASKIALENKKLLKAIEQYQFTGTCSQKLSQALELIQKAN